MKNVILGWWRWLKAHLARLLKRQRREAKERSPVMRATSRGDIKWRLPNMPRYQHCPNGHGQKRRVHKALGGALYMCNRCGSFHVGRAR